MPKVVSHSLRTLPFSISIQYATWFSPMRSLPPFLLGVLLAAKTKGDSIHCIYTDFSQTKDVGRCGTHVRSCKMEQEESRAYEEERRGRRAFLLARLPQGFVSISHCGGGPYKGKLPPEYRGSQQQCSGKKSRVPLASFPLFPFQFLSRPLFFPFPRLITLLARSLVPLGRTNCSSTKAARQLVPLSRRPFLLPPLG